jgi:ribosomal subunit interface protein
MNIIIKTKNLELTDSLQNFIEKKIGSIKKFIYVLKEEDPKKGKTLAEVFVEIEKESNHHRKGDFFRAEIMVILPGKKIVAEAKTDDLFKAIVEAKNELKMEIEKYKFKKIDKSRRIQRKLNKI